MKVDYDNSANVYLKKKKNIYYEIIATRNDDHQMKYSIFVYIAIFFSLFIYSCFEDCYWYCIEERFCFDKNIGKW